MYDETGLNFIKTDIIGITFIVVSDFRNEIS